MIEWHIQSRSHHCQRCNSWFRDKEPFHTLLSEERFGYARLDVCEECWENTPVDQETISISHWQSVYAAPPLAPPEPIQKENAENLLRRLVELHNPAHLACCYILAAMLERKRVLKVKEQIKRDGQRVFLYEHPKTGDLFAIVDPELQLNQLEQVQRDVALLLESGIAAELRTPSVSPEPTLTTDSQNAVSPVVESSDNKTAESSPKPVVGESGELEESPAVLILTGTQNRLKLELQTPVDGKLQAVEFRLQQRPEAEMRIAQESHNGVAP